MKVLLITLIALLAQPVLAADVINNPEEALAAFRAMMRKSGKAGDGKTVTEDTKPNDRTRAYESTSKAVHDRVKGTLLGDQYATSVRVGSLATLLPDRKVWVVSHSIDVFSGFDAVLDARDGKLIFLWYIPEG